MCVDIDRDIPTYTLAGVKTQIVEVTNGPLNWGKFLVGQFDAREWAHESAVSPGRLLQQIGHNDRGNQLWVLDLQTCEGAQFRVGGLASADLNKHRIWVCPMFEPFLTWLYEHWDGDLEHLPTHVDLIDAPFSMHGYRRDGPTP